MFDSTYGQNNNFSESKILERLNKEFLPEIEKEIGSENILEFETDLTSLDGLKTYGTMKSKIGIPTFDFYRNNVEIFDIHKLDKWWWLATAYSTAKHDEENWVKAVSPRGNIYFNFYFSGGVRPFCILKSNIFVSK